MNGIHITDGERRVEESYGWSAAERLEIAVLSDIHIPGGSASAEALQIRKNFIKVFDLAMKSSPHLVVIAGDLGQHKGCIDSYSWIKSTLERSALPYLIIPGNHDQGELMQQVFSPFTLENGKLYYQVQFGCWNFVFLDSSPDSVSSAQIDWMHRLMSRASADSNWALVMHHPPDKCGCRYMDGSYPLKDNEPLMGILNQYRQISHIFCGHYHIPKEIAFPWGTQLHLTPSTWFQIDEEEPEFTITDPNIGYREIVLDGCSLATKAHMLPPA